MKYGFSSSELQISDNVIQFVYSYFTFVLLNLLLILKMNRLNLLNTNFDERIYQNHGPRKDVCRFAICFTFICKQHDFQVSQGNGYIDVGDKWMLLTLFWWQFMDVSDRISILVTSFGCWCPALMKRMLVTKTTETVTYISKLSPTHSVTNIDVAQ